MRKGFTLIELMIVIAIIAMIAAIAIPNILEARERKAGVIGKVVTVGDITVTVLDVADNGAPKYKVLIMSKPPVQAEMDRTIIREAYEAQLAKQVEK